MTAGDDFQVPVAFDEPVRIVENLHIILIAFGEVDRVLMLPVMMILVKWEGANASRRDVQCGVTEVVIRADRRRDECRNKRIIDESVAVMLAFVPRTNEIGFRCVSILFQRLNILPHRFKTRDFIDESLARPIGKHIGIDDVSIVVEGIDIGL